MPMEGCSHHFFVADVIYSEQEGTAHVLLVCTKCGDFIDHKVQVNSGRQEVSYKSKQKG